MVLHNLRGVRMSYVKISPSKLQCKIPNSLFMWHSTRKIACYILYIHSIKSKNIYICNLEEMIMFLWTPFSILYPILCFLTLTCNHSRQSRNPEPTFLSVQFVIGVHSTFSIYLNLLVHIPRFYMMANIAVSLIIKY